MLHEIKCLVQCLLPTCSINDIHIYSLSYVRQLQGENTILDACLSAPRLKNKRSQKNFSRYSSKMTLVVRISGFCHAEGDVNKKWAGLHHQSFQYPSRAQDLEGFDRGGWKITEKKKKVCGGSGWRREMEGSLKVCVQHLHFSSSSSHTLNISNLWGQKLEIESLITGEDKITGTKGT